MEALQAAERIARAVCSDKYDGKRVSKSLMKGPNTSVSRLDLKPLVDHWDLFRGHVEKPPERNLVLIAEVSVGELQKLGSTHSPVTEVDVVASPLDWNPAHADIVTKLSDGLANKVVKAMLYHQEDGKRLRFDGAAMNEMAD